MIDNKAIYGTNNLDKLAQMFATDLKKKGANVDEVIAKYMPCLWINQSISTVAVRYSRFRKEIKNSRSKACKIALEKLVLYSEVTKLINDERIANAENRKEVKQDFSTNDFFNLIEKIKLNIEKKNFNKSTRQTLEQVEVYNLSVYLAMVTGRRFTEILKTMSIKKHGTKFTIMGLIKKSADENESSDVILLDDYKNVKKALDRVRKIFNADDYTNDQLNKKFSFTFNRYMKKYILETEKYNFHDLRKMYAQACYTKFGKNEDKKDFIAKVLGHKIDFTATDHYLTLKEL